MLVIAIDIDGTTTRWPEQMKVLAASPCAVVFLTGHSNVNPATADLIQLNKGRVAQLQELGLFNVPIHVCVGRNSSEVAKQKGEYCRDNNVGLFIDDSLDYCEAVRRISPNTCILHVFG